MATEAAKSQLTIPQVRLLRLLQEAPASTMGDLAVAFGCDASNITGIVDRLETRGLLVRGHSTGDRRKKTIDITPRGAKIVLALEHRMFEPPKELRKLKARQLSALHALVIETLGGTKRTHRSTSRSKPPEST